jgi:hypothetical protein
MTKLQGSVSASWGRAAAPALVAGLVLLALVSVGASFVKAAPEPDPIPSRWQLDLTVGPLRLASVDIGDDGPRAYFYLTYKVVNNSGEDLLLAPSFDLSLDGEVLRSDRNVPQDVTRELLRRLDNPLLRDQIGMLGPILQGVENAKFGIVVWPATDLDANDIGLYCAGFSGETATLQIADPETGTPARIILRKTYMVRYYAPGELRPGPGVLTPNARRWIMR